MLLFDETSSRAVDANDYTVYPVTRSHTHTQNTRARKKAVSGTKTEKSRKKKM